MLLSTLNAFGFMPRLYWCVVDLKAKESIRHCLVFMLLSQQGKKLKQVVRSCLACLLVAFMTMVLTVESLFFIDAPVASKWFVCITGSYITGKKRSGDAVLREECDAVKAKNATRCSLEAYAKGRSWNRSSFVQFCVVCNRYFHLPLAVTVTVSRVSAY